MNGGRLLTCSILCFLMALSASLPTGCAKRTKSPKDEPESLKYRSLELPPTSPLVEGFEKAIVEDELRGTERDPIQNEARVFMTMTMGTRIWIPPYHAKLSESSPLTAEKLNELYRSKAMGPREARLAFKKVAMNPDGRVVFFVAPDVPFSSFYDYYALLPKVLRTGMERVVIVCWDESEINALDR